MAESKPEEKLAGYQIAEGGFLCSAFVIRRRMINGSNYYVVLRK